MVGYELSKRVTMIERKVITEITKSILLENSVLVCTALSQFRNVLIRNLKISIFFIFELFSPTLEISDFQKIRPRHKTTRWQSNETFSCVLQNY